MTPTAPLTTAADWARAFSEQPTASPVQTPERAADIFLAKTYAICDPETWRTAMIGFLTTYAVQIRRDAIEETAQIADNAKRPVGYTYLMGQIADDIARKIRALSPPTKDPQP